MIQDRNSCISPRNSANLTVLQSLKKCCDLELDIPVPGGSLPGGRKEVVSGQKHAELALNSYAPTINMLEGG